MDELLLALSNVSSQVLPIAGAVALIFLCIVLNRVWKLIEAITVTVKNLDPTLKLVDQSIEKVQAPLDTVVKLSHSLDDVHDKASESIERLSQKASENADNLKSFVQEKLNKAEESVEEAVENE
ncbi:MAG: hypothetical protein IJ130_10310 [Solobacterium sp.]|nr:hypothetical protein [Erysipelotrichaceae bacterium]MBQ9154194.1 hypothetical protein [Solobacterium sp.]